MSTKPEKVPEVVWEMFGGMDMIPCGKKRSGKPNCFGFGHEPSACPKLAYAGSLDAWRSGPDTGNSSIAIYDVLVRKARVRDTWHYPHDPADFGRCHRLPGNADVARDGLGPVEHRPDEDLLAVLGNENQVIDEPKNSVGIAVEGLHVRHEPSIVGEWSASTGIAFHAALLKNAAAARNVSRKGSTFGFTRAPIAGSSWIATSTQPSTYKRGDTAFEEGRVVSAPLNREAPSSRRSRREGR